MITDYKTATSRKTNVDACLTDKLNTFYARFTAATNSDKGASGTNSMQAETAGEVKILEHDTRRTYRRVNTRKAAGPDGITAQGL